MDFLKPFSYLNQILVHWSKKRQLLVDEVNLVGGRWTGKTVSALILIWKMIALFPQETFSIFLIRKKKLKIPEIFNQFLVCQISNDIRLTVKSLQDKKIAGKNFFVQFVGFRDTGENMGNLGIFRHPGTTLNICFFDEAGEISNEEKIDLFGALPSNAPILSLYASNPWFPNSDFFQYIENHCPYDFQKMKKDGEIFRQKGKKIFHWTCPMLYKKEKSSHISKSMWKFIDEARIRNPDEADVIQYGKPMIKLGGVFPGAQKPLKIIHQDYGKWYWENDPLKKFEFQGIFGQNPNFVGGLDFGRNTTPTAMTISLIDETKNNLFVLAEKKIDTGKIKSQSIQRDLIIEFFALACKKFNIPYRLKIFCDSNERAFTIDLNSNNFNLRFQTVKSKKMKHGIYARNITLNRLFSNKKIWFHESCQELIKEFRTMQWKNLATRPVREDKFDDLINALEYSIFGHLSYLGL